MSMKVDVFATDAVAGAMLTAATGGSELYTEHYGWTGVFCITMFICVLATKQKKMYQLFGYFILSGDPSRAYWLAGAKDSVTRPQRLYVGSSHETRTSDNPAASDSPESAVRRGSGL
jgi:hypothetical protein